jgi:hypothetical protein
MKVQNISRLDTQILKLAEKGARVPMVYENFDCGQLKVKKKKKKLMRHLETVHVECVQKTLRLFHGKLKRAFNKK